MKNATALFHVSTLIEEFRVATVIGATRKHKRGEWNERELALFMIAFLGGSDLQT